ncbi:MAG: asparagine synthase (glutamine-hydrolyzing) [Planctomycetes bacterium]|nr:asparagine synthase (glutamine-hydrolyzing) [Planctomycetota bacterium]
MCGIAVSIGHIDSAVEAALERVNTAQLHRGPDAGALWRSPTMDKERGVQLAHRRLSIVDLSEAANQPMHDEETGNVLVYNGEIYGFEELRAELVALGNRFHTRSDTEVLLRAYAVWGPECVKRLRGMFVFALWDARKRVLVVARDRLGIKPLYYARVVGKKGRATLFFASELRSLLASELLERRISPAALATYGWNGFVNGDQAIVLGVFELPAAHWAEISLEGELPKPRRYWSVPVPQGPGTDDLSELRAELERAAREHLVSDVPVGVFLSGGIDSSAVSALTARAGSGKICTFTIAFDDPAFDESRYARQVSEQLGTQHREILLTEQAFGEQLEAALGCLDQPSFDAINTYFVSRAVREAGITVALAGTGGDEIFGGYKSFAEIPRGARVSRRLRGLPKGALRAFASVVTRAAMGAPGAIPPQTRWGKLEDALGCGGDLVDVYQVSYGLFSGRFLSEMLDGDVAREAVRGVVPSRREELRELVAGTTPLRAISALELTNFLEQRLLRDTDAASMAVSLEVRVPLLDHLVIEAAARLSDRRRFEPLGRKQALRDVALGGLDPAIFDRPKSGFVLPIERWARGGMLREVADTLQDARACRAIGLAPEPVSRLWKAFEAGAPGIYWSRVWSVFALLRWCAKHSVSLSGSGAGL